MYNQATHGPVDVITGDYLAEANLPNYAHKMAEVAAPGWSPTALAGIDMSLHVLQEKRIKLIVNGGALNPQGLAEKVHGMIAQRGLHLRVAFVDGDNLMPRIYSFMSKDAASAPLQHLDAANQSVVLAKDTLSFLDNPDAMPIVSANAYLGYRAIKRGLDEGADIIICGRVSDASPVIGAAAWWHGWAESDFDALAGALIAGHLIECSTYVTGANFAGAYKYPPSTFIDLGLPVTEVSSNGECVVTKHDTLGGFVTPDTVKCQLLYELQGNIYLNSDVKADIKHVKIASQGENRVHVWGVKGHPPPPATKLAVFYRAGHQLEILLNASGYATNHKWDVQEAQIRGKLKEWKLLDSLDVLDFQRVGVAKENPDSQLSSTTYMRIFAQAVDPGVVRAVAGAWSFCFMAHFPGMSHLDCPLELTAGVAWDLLRHGKRLNRLPGMHHSWDLRTMQPRPFFGYYPAVLPQNELEEAVTILDTKTAQAQKRMKVGPPKMTEPLSSRENYDTANPVPMESFGPKTMRPLGDVVLGRSGDKGGNVNLGLFVNTAEQYDWLRSFMTRNKLRELMRRDWRDWYFIERVEMPEIYAVHFVVYGPLGRGVTSSKLLDNLGKGFAEYIRAVWIPVPNRFLQQVTAKL